jgi:hypothetical protein
MYINCISTGGCCLTFFWFGIVFKFWQKQFFWWKGEEEKKTIFSKWLSFLLNRVEKKIRIYNLFQLVIFRKINYRCVKNEVEFCIFTANKKVWLLEILSIWQKSD